MWGGQGQEDEAAAGRVGRLVLMLGASTQVGETGPQHPQEAALMADLLSLSFPRVWAAYVLAEGGAPGR